FDVGRLSVFPAAKSFSTGRCAKRNACHRLYESHAARKRSICHGPKHGRLKRPRAAGTPASIVRRLYQTPRFSITHAAEIGGAVSGFWVATITSGRTSSSHRMVVVFPLGFG